MMKIALLTAGKDPHYALGLLGAPQAKPVRVEFIGDDEMADAEVVKKGHVEFYNLVGGQKADASLVEKALRVLRYYARLMVYAARTEAPLLHILWFRKFPVVERTLFSAYFKMLGKRLVFTAHNVDDQARDGKSTLVNRLSLRFLYRVVDHIFVHTQQMQQQLSVDFGVASAKITVVPHGINDVTPTATCSRREARQRLGFTADDKILLCFGNIAPYKGLEVSIGALAELISDDQHFRLVIAGPVKNRDCEDYWRQLVGMIDDLNLGDYVRKAVRRIPEDEVGVFFKAADVSVLPYKRIYQSGVLLLSYRQGLPVIAADVGSLREDILAGQTGFLFSPGDPAAMAATVRTYFASPLYRELETRSPGIREYGDDRFSWDKNVDRTYAVYERLLNAAL